MYFMFEICDVPLLNIDIFAWRTLAQITGDILLPPPEEMHRFNMETLLNAMHDPEFRKLSDPVSLFCISVCVFMTVSVISWFTNISLLIQ